MLLLRLCIKIKLAPFAESIVLLHSHEVGAVDLAVRLGPLGQALRQGPWARPLGQALRPGP